MLLNASHLAIDHFIPSHIQTPDSDPVAGEAANPAGRNERVHWLRAGFNAIARYVIQQQMAAARREIRRGGDRLSIRPDTD